MNPSLVPGKASSQAREAGGASDNSITTSAGKNGARGLIVEFLVASDTQTGFRGRDLFLGHRRATGRALEGTPLWPERSPDNQRALTDVTVMASEPLNVPVTFTCLPPIPLNLSCASRLYTLPLERSTY
jgi:hypothetical protein